MYSCIRCYTSNPSESVAIVSILKNGNLHQRISGLPGFIAYYVLNCDDGVVATVSVFDTQAGVDLSSAVAAEWVQENVLKSFSLSAPQVTSGEVILSA